ncbi:hypothetical protein FNV43_RR15387 [Rhamnella rubrinervis]|uniref:Protein PHYTOCHROME KINASE SUBSTRATE 4 n=1 Tax=Rhamnella rubrinervis TaxID=2594499 RepID=A0A8K0E6G1_9ROSA|nr:hypothetical protein FNV43_RR15387 [Rhamnella rubrinervis]
MERATVIRSSSSVSAGGSLISQKRSSFSVRDTDASFSSYLRPVHDENPRNGDNNNNNNDDFIVHQQNLPSSNRPCTTTLVDDSTEISIFDAQKYFNELSVVDHHHHHHQKAVIINGSNRVSPVVDNIEDDVVEHIPGRFSSASSSIDGYSTISRNYRARSFHAAATPTASSEASWNSQTGLLSVPPGTMAVSVRNPLVSSEDHEKKIRSGLSSSSSFSGTRWLTFRRKCPCSGKKSVQVKDKSLKSKTTSTHSPSPPSQTAIAKGLLQSHHVPPNPFTPKSSKTSAILEQTRSSMEMEKAGTANYRFQDDWGRRRPLDQVHRNSHIATLTDTDQVLIRPKQLQIQVQNQRAINGTSTTTNTSGFTFPILNVNGVVPSSSSSTVKLPVLKEGLLATTSTMTTLVEEEDPPRDSLEVFRPPYDLSVSSRKSADYRTPTNFTVPASPKSRTNNNDDDVASDASSDLFEIESFSTSTQTTTTATTATYPSMFQYHSQRRDSLDEASTFHAVRRYGGGPNGVMMMNMYCRRSLEDPMTPSTEYCYEPSEASIDWSVTTAEGFDRASVTNASEAEHARTPYTATEPEKGRRRMSGGSGLLMSCRCEKAVSVVGPQPVKLAAPVPQAALGGAERVGVGSGLSQSGSSTLGMWVVGTSAANKTPLARSHSARMSHPFATS